MKTSRLITLQALSLLAFTWFMYYHVTHTFNPRKKVASFVYYDSIKKDYLWEDKPITFYRGQLKVESLLESYLQGPIKPLIASTVPETASINVISYNRGELVIDFNTAILLPWTNIQKKYLFTVCY